MAGILGAKGIETTLGLSRLAFRRYRWQIVLLAVLGLVSGLLEGIGVNSLIPLLSFALDEPIAELDKITLFIRNFFEALHLPFSVLSLLMFIAALFVLRGITMIGINYIRVNIISDYEERARNSLFRKILSADWPYLVKQRSGHLETVMMIDVPASANLLNKLSNSLITAGSLAMYLLVALNIDAVITLLTLVMGAVIFVLFRPLVRRTKDYAEARTRVNKEATHHVGENILGVKTLKTMLAESRIARAGAKYFAQLKRLAVRAAMAKAVAKSLTQPIAFLYLIVLFVFFIYQAPNPAEGLIKLAPIVYLIQRIFIYIEHLQRTLHDAMDQVPHLKSFLAYLKTAGENPEIDTGKKDFVFKKSLEFKQVGFAYQKSRPVLRDINFAIKRGEMIGLIGPSGVGKTTLVDLILRLLVPTAGQILLDGREVSEIKLNTWRKKIGYVSQDIFLTHDTVKNNIKFFDESITDRDVEKAAQMANIDDFIQSLPDKYETSVGERGQLLSAGQRQRIVIARVLARKPELLILDEATSSLDNESEKKIQKVIHNLKGKITVIAIAHRLSTIMDSDRLIVLEKGRVKEIDEPEKLLQKKDSYFFKVYNIIETS